MYVLEMRNKDLIEEVFLKNEYGTLALCKDNKAYSLPINFVYFDGVLYFHGSKKGKKIDFLIDDSQASFSVVEPYSLIQSYFSSKDNLACPATQFFKSVICDGKINIVENYEEKVKALKLLMEKLQPEGKYIDLEKKDVYEKRINNLQVFKLIITSVDGKLKMGQKLPQERFDMIINYLKNRGYEIDLQTIKVMKENR